MDFLIIKHCEHCLLLEFPKITWDFLESLECPSAVNTPTFSIAY